MPPIIFPLQRPLGNVIGKPPLVRTILLDETQPPFNQLDWPNPPGRKSGLLVSINTRPVQDSNIAFSQNDWPNPKPRLLKSYTWVNNNLNDVLIPSGPFPFNQYDWPNPLLAKNMAKTWIDNPVNALSTPIVNPPINGGDFPNPQRKSWLIVSINSWINQAPSTQPPFSVDLFNNIPLRTKQHPRWSQNRPFYYNDIKPFNQNDYPNPIALKRENGFIFSRKLDEPIPLNPFIPVDYPNPKSKGRVNPDWTFLAPFQQIFTHPVGNSIYDIPVVRVKPIPHIWTQSRPFYYIEPTAIPGISIFTGIPARKRQDLSIHNIPSKIQLTSIIVKPFAQNEWPNPQKRNNNYFPWEFYYQLDDNNPQPAQFTQVPPQKRREVPLTFISRGQLTGALVSNPIIPFDYPNPIIVKKQNVGYLINLLQSTLNPGVGNTPFNQTDYPNPIRGKYNFPQGIQEGRKFYYTEPSIQIGQFDWPVFRPIKRNQVGLIQFIIPSEVNKFVSITDIPIIKKRIALSWIYSSLIDLTTITGIRPFYPIMWPAIKRKSFINFDWINRGDFILPNVVGRRICLYASETDFDLEANLEDFDLEAMITEYKLEAGGMECE